MQAFHNDQKIKDKYLVRVTEHQKADEIIQGKYWEDGKGCAVGCTIHGPDHRKYETELGIPVWLAHLEDRAFEGLPIKRAKTWPSEFLSAINVGADLEKIKAPFLIFVLESALTKFDHKKFPACKSAIDKVMELYKTNGSLEDFNAACAAADAAYAARAARAADAAYAAACAAADAAYAAAAYAADAAPDAWIKFADKLLELIRKEK